MKTKKTKLTYLLISIISISLFTSCYSEEKYYIPTPIFEIKNNTIISIENNSFLFNIDDTIIINSVVENTQTTTDGLKITLSDYYANDEEPKSLWHRLKLFKESNFGGLVSIRINEEYIESIEGVITTDNGSLIRVISPLIDETFKSKFGIKLKEVGTYYLSSNNGNSLISGGDGEKGIIDIYTKIINSEENGMYKFTVQ